MQQKIRWLAALVLVVGMQELHAENSAADQQTPYRLFLETLHSQCPQMVGDIVANGEISPAFAVRPLNNQDVCECTLSGMRADDKLREQLDVAPELAASRLKSKAFTDYAIALLVRHSFGCIAEDMGKSVAVMPLN